MDLHPIVPLITAFLNSPAGRAFLHDLLTIVISPWGCLMLFGTLLAFVVHKRRRADRPSKKKKPSHGGSRRPKKKEGSAGGDSQRR